MPETKEKELILENLKYIGLDLENIPDFLKNYKDIEYKPAKIIEQTEFKVYRYINLKDIQILLTPINKLASIVDKYLKSIPLSVCLKEGKEQEFNLFFETLKKLNKKEIKQIEEEQRKAQINTPFKVEYPTNDLWEVYYSELTGKYFMLVSVGEENNSALFYLLKKQIECYKSNTDELIYVPITHLDYTKRYLNKKEISDIEKYVWLFTKEWPKIYEVFDQNNELTMHIVGHTKVYDEIISYYKIELKTKEEAVQYYTLLQALFILKAELPHYYDFDTQINEKGELIFELNNKVINYKNLSKFVKDEYTKNSKELQKIFEEKEKIDIELNKLKEEELEKNKEYIFREKQVSTYLECRKSAFGKIKYFFKSKNAKFVSNKQKKSKLDKVLEENQLQKSISNEIIEEKEIYTIEDLIKICVELDRIKLKIKNAKLDIKSLKDNIKVITAKIENAVLFIETIEEHKKSIFEFWKFSNKDLPLRLNSGVEISQEIEEKEDCKDTYIYIATNDKLNPLEAKTFYFNSADSMKAINEEKVNLNKIKIVLDEEIKKGQRIIQIDMSNYKLEIKKQKIFRTNYETDEFNFKERIVCVYEYDARIAS